MTLFKKMLLMLALSVVPATHAARPNQDSQDIMMQFALTNSLEHQAAKELYRLATAVNKKLMDVVKTPEEPTTTEKRLDTFSDWFLKWEGNGATKTAKILSWPLTGLLGPVAALIIEATSKGRAELTITEKTSYAAYSLGLLAVQTFLLERTGIDSQKPIRVEDVITFMKDLIREQNKKRLNKEEARKLMNAALTRLGQKTIEGETSHHQEQPDELDEVRNKLEEINQEIDRISTKRAAQRN